jgi:serine/threonine protein kinase
MVGAGGLVKVVDFGLAKLTERPTVGDDESTVTVPPQTREGMIVGTPSYMSPEQAAGRPADARSDIFSFGSVLYEMVTGQRAFPGDSRMPALAAVLNQEPKPATQISRSIPRELERIINRCLRKDPERRFQYLADVKVALEELKEETDSGSLQAADKEPIAKSSVSRYRTRLPFSSLLVLLAVAAWFWFGRSEKTPPDGPLTAVPLTS